MCIRSLKCMIYNIDTRKTPLDFLPLHLCSPLGLTTRCREQRTGYFLTHPPAWDNLNSARKFVLKFATIPYFINYFYHIRPSNPIHCTIPANFDTIKYGNTVKLAYDSSQSAVYAYLILFKFTSSRMFISLCNCTSKRVVTGVAHLSNHVNPFWSKLLQFATLLQNGL